MSNGLIVIIRLDVSTNRSSQAPKCHRLQKQFKAITSTTVLDKATGGKVIGVLDTHGSWFDDGMA